MINIMAIVIYYPAYPRLFIVNWTRRVSFEQRRPVIRSFALVFIQLPTINRCVWTEGTNGALGAIFCSVSGDSCILWTCFVADGVAVAGVVSISSIPTPMGIFRSCTCGASSVDIVTNIIYELAILLQQFINLSLMFLYLFLLFPDDLQ